jgi:putative transposase
VRDAFSRYVLAVHLCRSTTLDVREVFERLFARHGVPGAIQCDNGTPFVSVHSRAGVSELSAWWMSLGIRLVRSRPGKPQDNGAHERMHADIAAEVQAVPAATREAQQRALDRWRQQFNAVRPHEALQGKTPSEVYKPVERRKVVVRDFAYPAHLHVVRVYSGGRFAWRGANYPLGRPFVGMKVGIEVVDPLHVRAWFRDVDLGLIEVVPDVSPGTYEQASLARRPKR